MSEQDSNEPVEGVGADEGIGAGEESDAAGEEIDGAAEEPESSEKGMSRRSIVTAAAWSAPVIVASVASPAAAASVGTLSILFEPTTQEATPFDPVPGFGVVVLQNGRPATGSRRVIMTLTDGLVWGTDETLSPASKVLTTTDHVLLFGGDFVPIRATRAGNFYIFARLYDDPVVSASTIVKVTGGDYTLDWSEPTVVSGFVGEPLAVATALTATMGGAATAGISVLVSPSEKLEWAEGAAGERTLRTDTDGSIPFAEGTFLPTSYELHSITATIAGDEETTSVLGVYAVPREALSWVKMVYIADGDLYVRYDAAAFDGPNRLLVRYNGEYLMESYNGRGAYSTPPTAFYSGTWADLRRPDLPRTEHDVVEVWLAPNKPGSSQAGAVLLHSATLVEMPEAAYGWVKEVRIDGSEFAVVFDKAGYNEPGRLVVTVNGAYLMESQNGKGFYGSTTIGDTTVTRRYANAPAAGGELVEVWYAPGAPGQSRSGQTRIFSATV